MPDHPEVTKCPDLVATRAWSAAVRNRAWDDRRISSQLWRLRLRHAVKGQGGRTQSRARTQLVVGFSRPPNLPGSCCRAGLSGAATGSEGSSFLEDQNGWKPPWTSNSHA